MAVATFEIFAAGEIGMDMALPIPGSEFIKYSAAVIFGADVLALIFTKRNLLVTLHFPFASFDRRYKEFRPFGMLAMEILALILLKLFAAVTGIFVPFPKPGSVFKKYSTLVIFGCACKAKPAQQHTIIMIIFCIKGYLKIWPSK